MGSIGPAEIFIVLVAALIILGPQRLPEAARQIGRALAEFRRVTSDLQAEVRDAFQHDAAAVQDQTAMTTPELLAADPPAAEETAPDPDAEVER